MGLSRSKHSTHRSEYNRTRMTAPIKVEKVWEYAAAGSKRVYKVFVGHTRIRARVLTPHHCFEA